MNRIISRGSLVERDRLIGYTTDEYFSEVNTWLAEQEMKEENKKQSDFSPQPYE